MTFLDESKEWSLLDESSKDLLRLLKKEPKKVKGCELLSSEEEVGFDHFDEELCREVIVIDKDDEGDVCGGEDDYFDEVNKRTEVRED